MTGVYLHVPFCFHKCHYCDFYSIVNQPQGEGAQQQARFADRLIAELSLRAGQATLRPRTVFVGGGTPTYLLPDLWRRLLEAMHRRVDFGQLVEFTVEANPETVTPELMRVLVDGGVNRVSLGAQSFHPHLLKTLERWHEPASVARAVCTVRDAGIHNVNLDLIFAVPGQTFPMLEADLDAALALRPDHLSCYGLTYEPNTAMFKRLGRCEFTPVEEEAERIMYDRVMRRLDGAGFEHYEVSNWARRDASPGGARRCEHNLLYWRNENWLGLGPSAASHVDGRRWKNAPHLGQYLDSSPDADPPIVDFENLDDRRRVGEELMLRLRLRQGAELEWLENRLVGDGARRATIEELIGLGMLERTPTHLRLTYRGLFVADTVIAKLL